MDEVDSKKPAPVRVRMRGTGTFVKEGDVVREFEFVGQQPGEPQKKNVRKSGQSELYETTGKTAPKMVATLRIPSDSSDPAADLYAELDRVTKDMRKKEPRLPRSKSLRDRDDLKVYWNKTEKLVIARLTIGTANRPSAQLFEMMSELNKILENECK